MTVQTWGFIFSGCATLAAVWVAISTQRLVSATKKQMEENTRNTQEMIKENSMLSWRNNVIGSVADFLGTVSSISSMRCLDAHDITNKIENLSSTRGEIRKIVFLLKENNMVAPEDFGNLLHSLMDTVFDMAIQGEKRKQLQEEYEKIENEIMKRTIAILHEE